MTTSPVVSSMNWAPASGPPSAARKPAPTEGRLSGAFCLEPGRCPAVEAELRVGRNNQIGLDPAEGFNTLRNITAGRLLRQRQVVLEMTGFRTQQVTVEACQ